MFARLCKRGITMYVELRNEIASRRLDGFGLETHTQRSRRIQAFRPE